MTDETILTTANTDTGADQGNQGQPPADAGAEGDAAAAAAASADGAAAADGEQAGDSASEAPDGEVPEKYEWTLPEGFEGELDQAAVEAFEPLARELGLTQEQANKMVELHAQSLMKANEAAREQIASQMQQWNESLRTDPDFGGAKFNENVAIAQKAVQAFGPPELTQVLNETGLGNHPALVKTFHQIGKAISEDRFVPGNQSSGPRSAGAIMYPDAK